MGRLRRLAPGVRWVAPDNLHLTLKFLGGIEAARLAAIESALANAAAAQPPFECAIAHLGAFPSRTRARVVWAGIGTGAAELTALAARVEDALDALGIGREARPFAAHVTLGRVREPRANPRLAAALAGAEAFGGQRVTRVSLMRSELSPRGARYTELAGVPLGPEA